MRFTTLRLASCYASLRIKVQVHVKNSTSWRPHKHITVPTSLIIITEFIHYNYKYNYSRNGDVPLT